MEQPNDSYRPQRNAYSPSSGYVPSFLSGYDSKVAAGSLRPSKYETLVAYSDALPSETAELKANAPGRSVADRIFGRQLLAGQLTIEERRSIAKDRRRLRDAHLGQILEWNSDLYNRIYFARRPYSAVPPQQLAQLERFQFQIETTRQKEELSFWSDMAEIYKEILETGLEHEAARDRFDLLNQPGGALG